MRAFIIGLTKGMSIIAGVVLISESGIYIRIKKCGDKNIGS